MQKVIQSRKRGQGVTVKNTTIARRATADAKRQGAAAWWRFFDGIPLRGKEEFCEKSKEFSGRGMIVCLGIGKVLDFGVFVGSKGFRIGALLSFGIVVIGMDVGLLT